MPCKAYDMMTHVSISVALFDENIKSSKSKFIGVFDPNCNVSTVVQGKCILEVGFLLCE